MEPTRTLTGGMGMATASGFEPAPKITISPRYHWGLPPLTRF